MNEQETTTDIIAEMRKPHDEICAKCHEEPNESCPYCGDPNGCNSPEYGQWPGVMTQLADRLEAAHRRERGDCAKLREALIDVVKRLEAYVGCDHHTFHPTATTCDGITSVGKCGKVATCATIFKTRAALAAPPRNCDVHTADELKAIFNSELVSELPIANEHEKNLVTITAMGVIDTLYAPATATEGGEKKKLAEALAHGLTVMQEGGVE